MTDAFKIQVLLILILVALAVELIWGIDLSAK